MEFKDVIPQMNDVRHALIIPTLPPLLTMLRRSLADKTLTSQIAESLHGKLMHASDQLFGLVGRAHTRAFRRRAHEKLRTNLNAQLTASITWWIGHLGSSPPRDPPC